MEPKFLEALIIYNTILYFEDSYDDIKVENGFLDHLDLAVCIGNWINENFGEIGYEDLKRKFIKTIVDRMR